MFYLFLAEGFEETEALACLDVMRRAKLRVQTAGVTGEFVIEGVILPGGMPGTVNLENDERVINCVKRCYDEGKIVAAICAAPSILGHLGFLDGKKATCFPGFEKELKGAEYTAAHTETDGNVITAKGAGCAVEFGHAIVTKALSKDDADKVIEDMQCL